MAFASIKMKVGSLECPICIERINDPRMLPCQHSLCGPHSREKCLEKLGRVDAGRIRCPVCRTLHEIQVADVPPNYTLREVLDSMQANEENNLCEMHGQPLLLRCKTDGKVLCALCVATDYAGQPVEGVHEEEKRKLLAFWNQQFKEFEGKYKGCHNWIEGIKEIVHFWDQQLKQVENLDHYYKEIQEKRETISAKLKDPNFNPDDTDIGFLKEYMDFLEDVSLCQDDWKMQSEDLWLKGKSIMKFKASAFTQMAVHGRQPMPEKTDHGYPFRTQKVKAPDDATSSSADKIESVHASKSILAIGEDIIQVVATNGRHSWWKKKGWSRLKENPHHMRYFEAECVSDNLYLIGGFDEETQQSSENVHIYNSTTQKWTAGPSMIMKRHQFAACVATNPDAIFVCGGFQSLLSNTKHVGLRVEKLRLNARANPVGGWTEVEPMNEARSQSAAVAIGSRVIVCGGSDPFRNVLHSVEILDTVTGKWTMRAPMKTARCHHAAIAMGESLYVMGGSTNNTPTATNLCERYYVATDVWVSIQSMCVPRFLSGSAALSNLIYIVGGRYQEQELACLEIYNPLNDTWFWKSMGSALGGGIRGPTRCVTCSNN